MVVEFGCGVGRRLMAMKDLDGGDVGGDGLDEGAVVAAVLDGNGGLGRSSEGLVCRSSLLWAISLSWSELQFL